MSIRDKNKTFLFLLGDIKTFEGLKYVFVNKGLVLCEAR